MNPEFFRLDLVSGESSRFSLAVASGRVAFEFLINQGSQQPIDDVNSRDC